MEELAGHHRPGHGAFGEAFDVGVPDILHHGGGHGLFGEDHGQIAQSLGRRDGAGDARAFHGQDLGRPFLREQAGELVADLMQKGHVDLMVQEGVHLHDLGAQSQTVTDDLFFKT